jgi:hypothetical protein
VVGGWDGGSVAGGWDGGAVAGEKDGGAVAGGGARPGGRPGWDSAPLSGGIETQGRLGMMTWVGDILSAGSISVGFFL